MGRPQSAAALWAVDYRAAIWVNGSVVGSHEGGNTPFTCDITAALQDGKGVLIVRAQDPPTDRYIPRGKQHWEERPASIFYLCSLVGG